MKAILLSGGTGSRLYPVTLGISKQLIPVYDKPMIYYPLSILMLAGIRQIMVITTPQDLKAYKRLLGNGDRFGISINYKTQKNPNGIAEAITLGSYFVDKKPFCLILGDNIFHGLNFSTKLEEVVKNTLTEKKGTIFGYKVNDPNRYGVIEFNKDRIPISIEEKPKLPKSNYAVVGLYFYTNEVVDIAKKIKPSKRGELEISSINNTLLNNGKLNVELLDEGFTWLDTGTPETLLEAGQFIETIEKRQGIKVGCLEEVAYLKGYISKKDMLQNSKFMNSTNYFKYLIKKYSK